MIDAFCSCVVRAGCLGLCFSYASVFLVIWCVRMVAMQILRFSSVLVLPECSDTNCLADTLCLGGL